MPYQNVIKSNLPPLEYSVALQNVTIVMDDSIRAFHSRMARCNHVKLLNSTIHAQLSGKGVQWLLYFMLGFVIGWHYRVCSVRMGEYRGLSPQTHKLAPKNVIPSPQSWIPLYFEDNINNIQSIHLLINSCIPAMIMKMMNVTVH
jgi:hypothetical protein